jgi:hypothetical protein
MRGMATAKPVMRKLRRIQDESIQGLIAHEETHGLSIPSGKISPLRGEMTIAETRNRRVRKQSRRFL